jgi:lysylphosphatidylglycerol synthetase-like protein (DUF2156 family)
MIITMLMTTAGLALFVAGFVLAFASDSKLRVHSDLAMAAGNLMLLVAGVVAGNRISPYVAAAMAAYHFWKWWTGGGGDGMKRRLKKWAKSFGFGPRTAPSTA